MATCWGWLLTIWLTSGCTLRSLPPCCSSGSASETRPRPDRSIYNSACRTLRSHQSSFVIELLSKETAPVFYPDEWYGRSAPLHVDLGCGDGTFLKALADEFPERNFLGIERLLHRVRSSNRKAAEFP